MAEKPNPAEQRGRDFKLEVPLDASGIEGFKPEQAVKILVLDQKGASHSNTVRLGADGKGSATFTFAEHPGAVRVVLGPENASAEELIGLQTISLDISTRQWAGKRELLLPAIQIKPYYWFWWLWWCRTFTIRGHVVCPDGSPVPGAKVCAFDVDWWFIFSSTQLVGCDMTDINGAFEIKFRWCCGWWPWWWWRHRIWQLDSLLTKQVARVLERNPAVRLSPITSNQPSLAAFKDLLSEQGFVTRRPLDAANVNMLDQIRERLLQKLPSAPELEQLHIWPWWPWRPWWDCTPDIIFKVTQDCLTPGAVIVDEGIGDTRWNIPNPLNVTLIANERACCRPVCHDPVGLPCPEGECLVIEQVCGDPINEIGGNPGAPAAPVGYLYPGAVPPGAADYNGDRPYAGIIPVEKNFGDMIAMDYYEIEHSSDGGATWNPLPAGAAVNFYRRWLETAGFTTGDVFFEFQLISGHVVVKSRERYESENPAPPWEVPVFGARWWLANRDLLVPLDANKFADGTYRFRVVGWEIDGGGNLMNRRVLPVCGTKKDNDLVLTFDNQVTDPMTHDPSHNCGMGVHACTQEPDTHIIEVRVDGEPVGACETVEATKGTLEIDFLVHDPDGHLAVYSLQATYGVNLAVNLLAQPGAVLTPIVPGTPVGPTYGQALGQGAVAPHWYGGNFRLTIPASQAFPIPCCYQLELRGWKRTVVGGQSGIVFFCEHGYAHNNLSEFTIGVGVCPPAHGVGAEILAKK